MVCSALGVGFFYIPYFSITAVSLEDLRTLPEKDITVEISAHLDRKTWGLLPQNNFFVFLFTASRLEQTLKQKFPKIKSITIKKRPPHAIAVLFEERKIWATICKDASCFYADEEGFLFGKSSRISGSLFFSIEDRRNVTHAIGTTIASPEEFKNIKTLLQRIETVTGASFSALMLSGSEDLISKYEIKTKDGWRIILDSKTNGELAAANFISAFEGILQKNMEGIDYIDVRLENKIFYKYK